MLVESLKQLEQLVQRWSQCAYLYVDTETTASSDYPKVGRKDALILDRARLVIITVATSPREYEKDGKKVFPDAWTIPCRDFESKDGTRFVKGLPPGRVLRVMHPLFTKRKPTIVYHNANYDVNVLANYGLDTSHKFRCTMLEAGMVDENLPKGLKARSVLYGRVMRKPDQINFKDLDDLMDYGEEDVVATAVLREVHDTGKFTGQDKVADVITDDIKAMKLSGFMRKWYRKVEIPVQSLVIDMERRGFLIDRDHFTKQFVKAQDLRDEAEQRIYEHAGYVFNMNSNPQKQKFIIDELGLESPNKTKGGAFSLDSDSLYQMRHMHPVIEDMLRYSELNTLVSRYLNPTTGIPAYADTEGYVHATQSSMGAKTSRFSVSLPPLQQIPKNDEFEIRKGFIAPPGHAIIRIDYSQIEIRMIANWTRDPRMVEALQGGGDIHAATAEMMGVTRSEAKTLNFGLFYGLGPFKLAMNLTVAGHPTLPTQAKKRIQAFFNGYRAVKPGFKRLIQYHRDHGFIRTICGRYRKIPNISHERRSLRLAAERVLQNNVAQASAADVIKLSMIRCANDADLQRWDCRMLLQIHDELLFQVPVKYAWVAARRVQELMEVMPKTVIECPVPFVAEPEIRDSWGGDLIRVPGLKLTG